VRWPGRHHHYLVAVLPFSGLGRMLPGPVFLSGGNGIPVGLLSGDQSVLGAPYVEHATH
jgi:hypothetical protein